jgi:hypothetical protein
MLSLRSRTASTAFLRDQTCDLHSYASCKKNLWLLEVTSCDTHTSQAALVAKEGEVMSECFRRFWPGGHPSQEFLPKMAGGFVRCLVKAGGWLRFLVAARVTTRSTRDTSTSLITIIALRFMQWRECKHFPSSSVFSLSSFYINFYTCVSRIM